jgi:predicted ATP-grasp superfamily ATP-dependent carboligase
MYLSNFENHHKAIETLAAGRALWGNPASIVRRVREPAVLAEALTKRGYRVPRVRLEPETTSEAGTQWLVKPLASGGGQRIRTWDGATLPRGSYLQEFIDGPSASVVFVAAQGRAVPFGVSRQLVGEDAFGARGYQYCGSILANVDNGVLPRIDELTTRSATLAQAVVDEFGLVGVNGIDFIARDGTPWPIEVNPRWSASMELVERAYGWSVFAAHASACGAAGRPAFDRPHGRQIVGAIGKAIIYARVDLTVGETRIWLTKDESIRDIPRPGDRILAGHPVCTIFATAADGPSCHEALVERAGRVYAQLEAWCA